MLLSIGTFASRNLNPKFLNNCFGSSFLINLFFFYYNQYNELTTLIHQRSTYRTFGFFSSVYIFDIWDSTFYSFILLIKPRIFNILIDSPSLNILSLSLSYLSLTKLKELTIYSNYMKF